MLLFTGFWHNEKVIDNLLIRYFIASGMKIVHPYSIGSSYRGSVVKSGWFMVEGLRLESLSDSFNVKDLKQRKNIIGWYIKRFKRERIFTITQYIHLQDMLESQGITKCSSVKIPMEAGCTIKINIDNKTAELNSIMNFLTQ